VNFAIVGCGLIGQKRMRALLKQKHRLLIAADVDLKRAQSLANEAGDGASAVADWKQAAMHPDVHAVIVATSNDALTTTSLAAVNAGKHVLVEKPAARTARELKPLLDSATRAKVIVKVGFNLRFHPALAKAKEIVARGQLGRLMYLRARYGHGGRLGMEKEWRANPTVAGGGEMLDQGVHLVDLARWYSGAEFDQVWGHTGAFFWNMPVEDNGFAFLKSRGGFVAWLHASCSEWKNIFSLEIYGRDGKLQIDGLGGSYGPERLTWYKMLPQMGPPETQIWDYAGEDDSWSRELSYFVNCIQEKKEPDGNLADCLAALEIIGRIYVISASGRES